MPLYPPASAGGAGTPGGADTQIQYNNGGAFGGDAALTWDDVNKSFIVSASQTEDVNLVTLSGIATDFSTGGGGILNTLEQHTYTLTQNAEQNIGGGTVVSTNTILDISAGTSGSPGTSKFIGTNYDTRIVKSASLAPEVVCVNFVGRWDASAGTGDTFTLAQFDFENQEGTLSQLYGLRFLAPTITAGAVSNYTAVQIDDNLGKQVLHLAGTTDTARFRSNVIIGTSSAITSGYKVDMVGRVRASTGLGVASTTTTNVISIGGTVARVIAMDRHTTSNTAGNNLTVEAGGATSAATDKAGGALVLAPGISTGTGRTDVKVKGYTSATATGTGDNTQVDRALIGEFKTLVDNTDTGLISCTLASNTVVAGVLRYAVEVFDGTDLQVEEGMVSYHVTNKGGTTANNTTVKFGNQQAMTAGTLTVTWTITSANPAVVTIKANSSLTPSTGYPRVTYSVDQLTQQAVSIL